LHSIVTPDIPVKSSNFHEMLSSIHSRSKGAFSRTVS
ncbi:hypothetical protein DBR06_SOUSAS9010079, partial [Sousa chinensis]